MYTQETEREQNRKCCQAKSLKLTHVTYFPHDSIFLNLITFLNSITNWRSSVQTHEPLGVIYQSNYHRVGERKGAVRESSNVKK
ncbi:hypothetical protein STEG23_017975, partial [Scotinomys teguina]